MGYALSTDAIEEASDSGDPVHISLDDVVEHINTTIDTLRPMTLTDTARSMTRMCSCQAADVWLKSWHSSGATPTFVACLVRCSISGGIIISSISLNLPN